MEYHRRSIRLDGFNYSENGYYFVTICAGNRGNVFGEIVGARRDSPKSIKLNQNGKIINDVWKTLPEHNDVILDEFVIMPDHVHFILIINYKNNLLIKNDGELIKTNMGASRRAPTLGFIVGMFKTECTKQINKLNKTPGIQLWQRNYYERIIRNEKEYLMIKEYIKDNPKNLGL